MQKKKSLLKIYNQPFEDIDSFLSDFLVQSNINNSFVELCGSGFFSFKKIDNSDVDIIHLPSISYLSHCSKSSKVVVDVADKKWSIFNKYKMLRKLRSVDHIITPSDYVKDKIQSNLGVGNDKVSTIYNYVDLSYYDINLISTHRVVEAAKSLNFSLDKSAMLVMGDLSQIINHLDRLSKYNLFLIIYCSSSDDAMILYKKLKKFKNVSIVHDYKDLPSLYMLCDFAFLAFNDIDDILSKSITLQYMGKQVIIDRSIDESLFNNSSNLFASEDYDGYINKILSLDPIEFSKIQHVIRLESKNFASLEFFCSQYLPIYKKLLLI